ncbi:MAG: sigma-54 dependent transcriptional regulator [Deltaproteobacteria bacterium]|nr:sigma-54 dependent transcriptional regulator [Deltaproteobacteria bacterium]
MGEVLIVDDNVGVCRILHSVVEEMGHHADYVRTLGQAMKTLASGSYDVVLLDVHMPDGNGLDLLPRIRETKDSPEVIIITGKADPNGAELAIKSGAWDYLQKPLSLNTVVLPLKRVLQYRKASQNGPNPTVALKLDGIIGRSKQMQTCFDALARSAAGESPVLITGETGTGKELFARACHHNSPRSDQSFITVDCAAMPETLVESMLFGHKKGAFTGANRSQPGLIEQAHGGTLFLDEVGELPDSMQKAFLRVLQENRFRPVGGQKELRSDFRLISATNRNLDRMVDQGRFRKDLIYRLRGQTIELSPLRCRPDDIKDLVLFYSAKLCERHGVETKGISPDFLEAVLAYPWPGNVRELIHSVESALAEVAYAPTLIVNQLPVHIRVHLARASVEQSVAPNADSRTPERPGSADPLPTYKALRESVLHRAEKEYLREVMVTSQGAIQEACRISDLGRTRLYSLLKKHGISRVGWDSPAFSV